MTYEEFNRKALLALNSFPQKDRLRVLRLVGRDVRLHGWQYVAQTWRPLLDLEEREGINA